MKKNLDLDLDYDDHFMIDVLDYVRINMRMCFNVSVLNE